jgi:hypothetical protein
MKKPQIRMKRVTVKAQQDGQTFEYLAVHDHGGTVADQLRIHGRRRQEARLEDVIRRHDRDWPVAPLGAGEIE